MVQTDKDTAAQTVDSPPAQPSPPTQPSRTFEDFYRDNYRSLIKVALTGSVSMQQAEDVVDATMLEVMQRWTDAERPLTHPAAWARKAVFSNVLKAIRDNKHTGLTADGRLNPDDECEIDTGLTAWEDQQWVDQMIESLPPAQREVMRHTMEGLTTREISGLLGKTPQTVRKNLQWARQRLQDQLRRDNQITQDTQPPHDGRAQVEGGGPPCG